MTMAFPDTPGIYTYPIVIKIHEDNLSGESEEFGPIHKVNLGYEKRKMYTSASNSLITEDALCIPVSQTGKLLPPNLSIQITLQRTPESICLCSPSATNKNYRIVIESCELEVERVRLVDPLVARIYSTWREKSLIRYAYNRICPVGPMEIGNSMSLLSSSSFGHFFSKSFHFFRKEPNHDKRNHKLWGNAFVCFRLFRQFFSCNRSI